MKRKERSTHSPGADTESKKKKSKTENRREVSPSKLDFSTAETVLEGLLSPTNLKTFFSDYWEKKPLVIKRKDAEYYGDMFLKKHLEDLLKKHKLQYEDDINVCRYVEGKKEFHNKVGRATFAKIEKDFKSLGATLQFHQPQRFKDDLWQLNEALEQFFGCLVGANVYITPSKSQGLAPHHDDVEVFVLQLEGKKHWKLYKPLVELSQDYSPDLERDEIGEPTHEFDLEQGDLLYFPRGTIHEAEAVGDGEHSTHVTISTYQNNSWGDLLMSCVSEEIMQRAMSTDVEFRRGLPINCRSYVGYQYMQHEDHRDQDVPSAETNGFHTEQTAVSEAMKQKQQDFISHLGVLMGRLANYFDPCKNMDAFVSDFMSSRLPPFASNDKTTKKGKEEESPPTDDSSIRLMHPDHVRLMVLMHEPSNVGDEDSEDEDADQEEEEESDAMSGTLEESSDEIEEDEKPVDKKTKSGEEQLKREENNTASDKKSEEEEDEDEQPANKKIKSQGRKQQREETTKEVVEKKDEEQEERDEERKEKTTKKKKTRGKQEQPTESKEDSKEKAQERSEEDEDDDQEEEAGEEDDEEEEEDEGEEEAGPKEWIVVSHSLNNDRIRHMIGEQEPSAVKFPPMCKEALRYILSRPRECIPVSTLPLPEEERVALVTSLWAESLIEKV